VARYNGDIDVLKALRLVSPASCWNAQVCAAAAAGGQLETLSYLHAPPPEPEMEKERMAAVLFKWMRRGFGSSSAKQSSKAAAAATSQPCVWDASTCMEAARGGHLSILVWLRAQTPPASWGSDTCSAAAAGNHF
jgi:hypothetical protein